MADTSTLAREVLTDRVRPESNESLACEVAVIWIDWYAYHVARFQGLLRHPKLAGRVAGMELVGGVGVHQGLKFREELPASLPIETLLPASNWKEAGKWQLCREIWRRLDRLNPSVVLVPGYYTAPALTAAVWAKCKRKCSVLMTESTAHDHSRSWLRESFKKVLINALFDWAVAGGKPHRRYLNQLGFSADRIAGCYDVVDNAFFNQCCQDLRANHKASDFDLPQTYFLYVGRIAPEKSTALLLTDYVRYRVSGGLASLVLVGDGPELKDIRTMAANTTYASDIYFPGLKATSELPKYYAFASAFVLPSRREPWGLVVNEAMASGLPVIVSNRCGCVEDLVIEGENGLTFDPTCNLSLTACLQRFERFSLERRRQMGMRSYEMISRFSPSEFASEIQRIVSSTI